MCDPINGIQVEHVVPQRCHVSMRFKPIIDGQIDSWYVMIALVVICIIIIKYTLVNYNGGGSGGGDG